MAVITLDVGTSGIKSVMYELDGSCMGSVSKSYALLNPSPGCFELSPADVSEAAFSSVEELLDLTNIRQIELITATSFGESVVLLDECDNPICNILLYIDERGSKECIEFKDICDGSDSFLITGEIPHPMLSIYKLKFLKRANLLRKLHKIHFIADYILHLFGGEHYTDCSLAARSGMMEMKQMEWWGKGLDYLDINEECFPRIVKSGSRIGTMKTSLRKKLKIKNEVDIIIGGHDQIIASIGAGILRAGQMMNGLGSVDNMTVTYGIEQVSSKFFDLNFCIMPYPISGVYASYLYNFSGGNLIRWYKNEFMKDLFCDSRKTCENQYALMDSFVPPVPTNILVTPHFNGAGTPSLNLAMKGIFSGLTFETTREELYRAILEGEALDMKMNLVCLEEIGIIPDKIITVGGGSGSDVWMQIRADVFGKEICVYDNRESGTKGSAILALVNNGLSRDYETAHSLMTKGGKVFYPNPDHLNIYNEKFFEYKKLYELSMKLYG